MEFNPEVIETFIMEEGLDWAINIAGALAIFIIGKMVAKIIRGTSKKLLIKAKMDETLVSFLGNIIYTLALAFVLIAALSQLGVETTSLAAVLAAAGLAIGLALQGSLSNLAAGVMIIAFRPFVKGNFIEAAGTSGTVHEVTIFTTILKTPDNKKVIVPNSAIISGNITNFSAEDKRRIDFTFGIGYDDDIRKAKDVLKDIIESEARILKDPEPVIAVSELADSSVNFVVRPWVNASDYWGVYFDITETVKLRFDAEGISIPYPQQDVHMHQADSAAKAAA
ncbi:MAG: mechanosensitive ion channel [Rickettsiales bacterium]|nr:mechanosensitive ion channel [Rickettsiales bacterium]